MEDVARVSVELKSPAMMTLAPCFLRSMASTALTVAMVPGSLLGKYAVTNHTNSFSQATCTKVTFVSVVASLASRRVRVAAP